MLICNISPAKSSVAETLSSLRFAERAKQVENKATVNQDPKAVARLRLMKENSRLLDMVQALRKQLRDNNIVPEHKTASPSAGAISSREQDAALVKSESRADVQKIRSKPTVLRAHSDPPGFQ